MKTAKQIVESLLNEGPDDTTPAFPTSTPSAPLADPIALAQRLAEYGGAEKKYTPDQLRNWIRKFKDKDWDKLQQNDDDQEWGPDEIKTLVTWAQRSW